MRKQIETLMKQAGTDTSGKWMGVEHAEKFAELIINQCANRATWAQDTGKEDIGGEVLKHFGVKE